MSTLQPHINSIRSYELRLIRSTLSSPPSDPLPQSQPSDHYLHNIINGILASIESGSYLQAITSEPSSIVFQLGHDSPLRQLNNSVDSADRVYSELLNRAEFFVRYDSSDSEADKASRVVLVVCIAVAAFLGFTQCNFTGPLMGLPRCPLPLEVGEFTEWDNWARNQLMSSGSHLLGKFSNLQYIVFAKMLLMRMKDLLFQGTTSSSIEIRSLSWWLARILLLQQRILDERSSSLCDMLHVYMGQALKHFSSSDEVKSYWVSNLHDGESLDIVSMLHLEAGIMEYAYGRVDSCRKHFESAEVASGLQLSVTGALGFRTVHQVEPKAQRVLVTNTSSSNNFMGNGIQKCDSSTPEANLHKRENCEASDILIIPKLLENDDNSKTRPQGSGNGVHTTTSLTATQQAVILAHCLLIEKSSRQDELQRWDMAPYIEAIDSQHLFYFIIRCFCDILRIRWESSRSRTKERALLMMENMVQHIYESSPAVAERTPLSCGVYMPSIPALRKEYGELLVRCGLIGEALKVFEDLELWDNLIHCYCLLEKKATAVELIRKRLSERPNDPRLWCSLGDTTTNDTCYEKALEVSNNRSARAKRSLARSAYNRGDYETSKILWESAMSMNSMYPDGWFAFGAAALKARDIEKALDAFTRAVQLDPDNGEAWNNIACLHLIKKKSKEAFIAFKEALKFKRNSWQLWENYSHVAVDVGNISQALEGAQMVLDLSNNKRVDAELLEKITREVEGRLPTTNSLGPLTTDNESNTDQCCVADSGSEHAKQGSGVSVSGRSRETEQLISLLGKVLQQIVKHGNGCGPDIWGLYAKWHRINGDLVMCSEALLKQVRSLQGSDTWKDQDRFRKFAKASLELCKVYMEISSSTGSRKELFTAEMHLKNIIKQGQSFSDTEEFSDLQACHDEVKIKLQPN
ncbi:putative 43kDa postsynaptic protein [Lupinus albus]|uniref:Putative 43kDa postsynaptic protein n=1 Tax=Lupinus albus TaxID=3870 RepID=A0A6A4Q3U6_LUPAL|nr:putative 43kDa postsynaptic protein [Lupinus albus]